MTGRRITLLVAVATVAAAVGIVAFARQTPREAESARSAPMPRAISSIDARLAVHPDGADAVLVGGGAEPESSGVQLEQDVELAARVLGPRRYMLFGGGRGADIRSVRTRPARRTEARMNEADATRALLAELFDPRERTAAYRATTLRPDAPAMRVHLLEALTRLTSVERAPFTLFIAAHGAPAEDPSDAALDLWSGDVFGVRDLAEVYTNSRTRIVAVITSCYGGAFAETALDTHASVVSCGLFATTHDRVASGCDENPERSAQEGFALHFWNALRSMDRAGEALSRETLDLDRDGRVSYLEAHARARIASRGFDVPTTTSERYLRALTTDRELDVDALVPTTDAVEQSVIDTLAASLDARELAIARAMALRLADELAELEGATIEAEERRDEAYRRLRIALLERWPHLDDPWHPDHHDTLVREGTAITALLSSRPELRVYREESERAADLADAFDEKLVEESRLQRLVRAMENVRMMTAVREMGGEALARYEALRRCELGP